MARIAVVALALHLAAAATAAAQEHPVTIHPERSETVTLYLGGRLDIDWVFRSRELTAYTNSFSNPTQDPLATVPNPLSSNSENTFEGQYAFRFDARLPAGVSAVVEVGRRRAENETLTRYGDATAPAILLREARANVDDLIVPGLSVELGITTWSFNPRGKGGSLAFEPRSAASSHDNLSGLGNVNQRETADARLFNAGFPIILQPVGAGFRYVRGPVTVELTLLPATVEGGRPSTDEALYAVDVLWNLPQIGEGSRFGLIAACNSLAVDPPGAAPGVPANEHADIYTVGGGFDFKLFDGALEVYVEAYVQAGKASETALGDQIKAAGRALRGGFEWNHKVANPLPIWAGISFMHLSGDDDTDPNDKQANRFSAYESVSDLLILEDPFYGFDWDTNYEALKVYGGLRLSVAKEHDLEVGLILAFTRAAEEVGAPGAAEDALGTEVDLRLRWDVNSQFTVHLAVGVLTGSKVLENAMDLGVPGSNPRSSDHAALFVLGSVLTF